MVTFKKFEISRVRDIFQHAGPAKALQYLYDLGVSKDLAQSIVQNPQFAEQVTDQYIAGLLELLLPESTEAARHILRSYYQISEATAHAICQRVIDRNSTKEQILSQLWELAPRSVRDHSAPPSNPGTELYGEVESELIRKGSEAARQLLAQRSRLTGYWAEYLIDAVRANLRRI